MTTANEQDGISRYARTRLYLREESVAAIVSLLWKVPLPLLLPTVTATNQLISKLGCCCCCHCCVPLLLPLPPCCCCCCCCLYHRCATVAVCSVRCAMRCPLPTASRSRVPELKKVCTAPYRTELTSSIALPSDHCSCSSRHTRRCPLPITTYSLTPCDCASPAKFQMLLINLPNSKQVSRLHAKWKQFQFFSESWRNLNSN